jgi:hypothetical protein
MNWAPFWFETNSAWGLVDSPEAWVSMREKWNKGDRSMKPNEIYSNNLSFDVKTHHQITIPSFGRRIEHIGGKTTLGEFFDANGMDRNVGP